MPSVLRKGPLLPLLAASIFLPFLASGQTLPPEISTFSMEEKRTHGQIFNAQSMPDGRTIFGTYSSILVYNGEGFDRIPIGSGKYVMSMELGPDGRLFYGGQGTMGYLSVDSTGAFVPNSLKDRLPDSLRSFAPIWSIQCKEDKLRFLSKEELITFHRDSIEVARPDSSFYILHTPEGRSVVQDGDKGLFLFKKGKGHLLPGSKKLTEKGRVVRKIFGLKGKGELWVVFTEKDGAFEYHPQKGTVRPFPSRPIEGSSTLQDVDWKEVQLYRAVRLDPEKNPYGAAYAIGTNHGGVLFAGPSGRILTRVQRKDGCPSNSIWSLEPDDKGNLWVTTDNGMALFHTGAPFTIAREGEWFNGSLNSIERSSRGDSALYLSSLQGLWKWQGKKEGFELVKGTSGYCFDVATYEGIPSLSENEGGGSLDAYSRLIIAAGNSGVLSKPLDEKKASVAERIFDRHTNDVTPLPYPKGRGGGPDRLQGGVISGGRAGVFVHVPKKKGEVWEWHTALQVKQITGDISTLSWERDRGDSDSLWIWAGSRNQGVFRVATDTALSGYRVTHFDSTSGLPKGAAWVFRDPSSDGVVFGTDRGLFRYEKGRVVPDCRYGEQFCNGDRKLFLIRKGHEGEIWIDDGSEEGIRRSIPEKEGYRIDSLPFRFLDIGSVQSIYPEKERVWFAADRGLACYFKNVEKDYEGDWNCLIEKVTNGKERDLFNGYFRKKAPEGGIMGDKSRGEKVPVPEQAKRRIPELPYAKNRMAFEFAAPFPDRQEAVEYRYILSGFDTSWSKWTQETKKEYTNLREGTYTFRVKARNVYLKESSTAEYRFRILPPWYRTWPAYTVYGVSGVGLIWLIVFLNGRRLHAQKQRLERVVEERTREIREQKEKVEKKNQELEKANETISEQKKEVEEEQRETEKQREEAERQRAIAEEQKERVEQAHEKLQEAHSEITDSIAYARKIQFALLGSEEHVSSLFPSHFILFKPQSQVSGDFYWGREHKGYIYFAAVDCTGHGVPGAFMSMLGISQLNEIMNTEKVPTPGAVLSELRDRVVRELSGQGSEERTKDGMDAAVVKIPVSNPNSQISDPKTIEFAGAQNPLYVIRKGIADVGATHVSPDHRMKPFKKSSDGIEIKGDPMPVGYDEYASGDFTTVSLQLQKGDMLYMFSDGYADQFGGPKGKKFRYGPFKKLLADLHEKPLEEQKAELDRVFEEWKAEGEQEQIDDVVVIGVRV